MTPDGGYTLLTSRAELADLVARWRGVAEIALDTEFVFERTFRPRPGLVQLACDAEVALLDVVALGDLAPLAALLVDPASRKYAHAGGADVELLARLAGVAPAPLFDTQVGAAFAGLGTGLSYAAVVAATQGVTLAKSQTRTDWTRRPLAAEQLRYAAEDVSHLLPAARALRERLAELGRLAWADDESRELHSLERDGDDPEPWHRLRGLEGLPPPARAVARELARWREREADRRDLARPFLMRDETLLALARRDSIEPDELARLPGYDARRHRALLDDWRAAHAAALAAAAEAAAPPDPQRPSRAERERLTQRARAVAAAVAEVATRHGLPAELLLSRRRQQGLLAAVDRGEEVATVLSGFRRELLAEPLRWLDASRS
ncbi:MAG: HRDC domain-containing protein [Thermoanaerobaculia bacterium]|nr:HRDC domain-containing protein [Thermoanaerobaculia bacterium]